MLGWILLALAPLLLFGIVAIVHYNRFQTLENRCDESWSNVDTELRRRHELIPNLVASVKGYATHERGLQTAITEARKLAATNGANAKDAQGIEQRLGRAMGRLLAVAEAYPDLKASSNFLQLQEELSNTEDRIQAARRFYNGNVRDHRNATRQFPGTLFAAWFKPTPQEFFQMDPVVAKPVPVDL